MVSTFFVLLLAANLEVGEASYSSDDSKNGQEKMTQIPFSDSLMKELEDYDKKTPSNIRNPLSPSADKEKKMRIQRNIKKLVLGLESLPIEDGPPPITFSGRRRSNTGKPEDKRLREQGDPPLVDPIWNEIEKSQEDTEELPSSSGRKSKLGHENSDSSGMENLFDLVKQDVNNEEEHPFDLTSPDTDDLEIVQGIWRYEPDSNVKYASLGVGIIAPYVRGREVRGTEPGERLGLYKDRRSGKLWMKGYTLNMKKTIPQIALLWQKEDSGKKVRRFWWKRVNNYQHAYQMRSVGTHTIHNDTIR
mmetsp:Transcript_13158/g.18355  ORF Transcript_13158/g.18355 Transcript_13158/m.18355 type:complete len:304 (+) Transcript_13158:21-932(+)